MKDQQEVRKYDGITETSIEGYSFKTFNIAEALEDKNPRNVFLNAQLYIESAIDIIIAMYFCKENHNRYNSLTAFLKSREATFETKIFILKNLIEKYQPNLPNPVNIIWFIEDRRIISSLKTIAQVRNAFQHNLPHSEAFTEASKNGAKFTILDKKLSDCGSIDELVNLFKQEALELYNKLDKIIIDNFAEPVKLDKLAEKGINLPSSDKKDNPSKTP